jgi:diguanylate cyclase (GGDEF)-like protein
MKKPRKGRSNPPSSRPSPMSLGLPAEITESEVIKELRQTVQKLKVFDSLGKAITASLDLKDILRIIVEKLGALIESRHVALLMLDPETNDCYFEYPLELKEKKASFPIGHGLLGRCLERGRGGVFLPPLEDSGFQADIDALVIAKPSSVMTLPIMSRGSVLGLLVFYTQENENPLGEEQFKTVETFSDYLSIAVENASNFQKVRELTVTDDLTKLYNSRYLHLVLERELARSERYQEQFSLVFIDLDNFKKINDSSGHMAGSLILKEFGDFLVRAIRISDIAIRYGGDEFVLVLPNTSKNEAVQFVTRARETLNQSVFLKSRGLSIKCTASFGISSFPEDGRSVDQLISAADKAMYMVKRGSKDGIQAYTQPATMIKGDRLPS